jgi:hypothetical protein
MSWRCRLYNRLIADPDGRGTGNFECPEQGIIRRFRPGTGKEQAGETRAQDWVRPGCKASPGFPSLGEEGDPSLADRAAAARPSTGNGARRQLGASTETQFAGGDSNGARTIVRIVKARRNFVAHSQRNFSKVGLRRVNILKTVWNLIRISKSAAYVV